MAGRDRKMSNRNKLIGQKFNRLTVIKLLGKKSGHNNYLCQCDCGNFTEALPTNFKQGKVKSCGCLRRKGSNLKHGLKKHYLYRLWTGIKTRCYIKTTKCFHNYGGRGIKMFPQWRHDFKSFYDWILQNLGDRPSDEYSLDRIDNDKNYEPFNLRWAIKAVQSQNSRRAKIDELKVKLIYDAFYILNKTISQISREMDTSWGIVNNIVKGRCWNNITGLPLNREKGPTSDC